MGGGLSDIEVVRPGPSLPPSAPRVGSGSGPRPVEALPPEGRPVQNGAPVSLVFICLVRSLLHSQASLCLM